MSDQNDKNICIITVVVLLQVSISMCLHTNARRYGIWQRSVIVPDKLGHGCRQLLAIVAMPSYGLSRCGGNRRM
jgi:hypothetical protein